MPPLRTGRQKEQAGAIDAREKGAPWGCAVGYGIVCGLVFPLMVSSVFLQEMTLSHGAGHSFGLLFFIAYGLTMAAWAAVGRLGRGAAGIGGRMAVGLAGAFVGNALMLCRQLGVLPGGWAYAVAAAGTIGFGLATAELAWLDRIAGLPSARSRDLTRVIAGSYLVGCAASAFIFAADGPFELTFALASIVGCAALGLRRPTRDVPVDDNSEPPDFLKATLYLGVFSFVFGAISQASTAADAAQAPTEFLALLGIALAGAGMLAATWVRRRTARPDDLYWLLFPVVAPALVLLPFIESPLLHGVATALVFSSYYLTGINIRTAACRIGARPGGSASSPASAALAVGCACILGGVAVGAFTLANGATPGLAFISLVSLFVLSLNPLLARFVDRRRGGASTEGGPEGSAAQTAPRPYTLEEKAARLARDRDLTARETEVLVLMCQGRTRTYIATELGLSPNTVKGYMHSLYQKADVGDKQELIDLVNRAR